MQQQCELAETNSQIQILRNLLLFSCRIALLNSQYSQPHSLTMVDYINVKNQFALGSKHLNMFGLIISDQNLLRVLWRSIDQLAFVV